MDVNAEDVIADLLQELTAAKRDKAYQAAAVVQIQRELNKVTEERDILAERVSSLLESK